jgi:hypothetical protein
MTTCSSSGSTSTPASSSTQCKYRRVVGKGRSHAPQRRVSTRIETGTTVPRFQHTANGRSHRSHRGLTTM